MGQLLDSQIRNKKAPPRNTEFCINLFIAKTEMMSLKPIAVKEHGGTHHGTN